MKARQKKTSQQNLSSKQKGQYEILDDNDQANIDQTINKDKDINEKITQNISKPKVNKLRTPTSNRLGALIYHPDLAQEHKQFIERKFQRINHIRTCIGVIGLGAMLYHLKVNKFMLSKTTPLFIIVPSFLSYFVKFVGFYWIQNKIDNLGLFKEYKIMFA